MTAAPDVPARIEIEQSLEHLLQSLLELGICASDVQESALESSSHGIASQQPGGLIGRKATQTIESFARLHALKDKVGDTMIPFEVISVVDQGKNPHSFTKDFIERLSGENMYTNGILSAVSDYRDLLTERMKEAFPDLSPLLDQQSSFAPPPPQPTTVPSSSSSNTNGNDHSGGEYGLNGMNGSQLQEGGYQNGSGASGENGEVKMEQDMR